MAKHRILQNGPLLPALESRLASAFDLHKLHAEADPVTFLERHGREFPGLVTSGGYGADAALIDALPSLKVISSFGVGYDKIDEAASVRRGLAVGNTPDVLNDCVADLAFALILDVARSTVMADRFLRRCDFAKGRYRLATKVSGKKLGILGLGRIGQAIARRSAGFDMEVGYHTRKPVDGVSFQRFESPQSLARWADFLVVVVAGGKSTQHLVSREVIDALGPDGYLINVSRGTVVDEAALIEALAAGRIAGAGLDVYEHEPHVPEALMALDNVVLLPHIGSGTHETRQAMADLTFANLQAFFDKGVLLCAVPWSASKAG